MVSEDLLSLLKSWKEIGVTQIETSTPGYLESKILVQFGYYSNFYRPARCIGSPRRRWGGGGGGGEWTRDIWKALGLKTWALLPLHHLTQSSVQMEKLILIPFCTMTSKQLLPGASSKACVWEMLHLSPSCPSLAGFLFCNNPIWSSEEWPPSTPFLAYH